MYQTRQKGPSLPIINAQPSFQPRILGSSFSQPAFFQNPGFSNFSYNSNISPKTNILKSSIISKNSGPVIKGESFFEKIPFERTYFEQMEVQKIDYMPVERKIVDYYRIEHQTEYIPQTRYDRYIDYKPIVTIEYDALKKTEYIPQQRVEYLPKTRTDYIPKQRVEEKVDYFPIKKSIVHPNPNAGETVNAIPFQSQIFSTYRPPVPQANFFNSGFQQLPRNYSLPQRPFIPVNIHPTFSPTHINSQIPTGKCQRSSDANKIPTVIEKVPSIHEKELPIMMVESIGHEANVEIIFKNNEEKAKRSCPVEQEEVKMEDSNYLPATRIDPLVEEIQIPETVNQVPVAINQAQEEEIYVDPYLNPIDGSKNIGIQENLENESIFVSENISNQPLLAEPSLVSSPPQINVLEVTPGTLTHVETVHVGEKIVDGRMQMCPCEQCWKKQYYDSAEANRPKNKTLGGVKVLPDFIPPRRETKL